MLPTTDTEVKTGTHCAYLQMHRKKSSKICVKLCLPLGSGPGRWAGECFSFSCLYFWVTIPFLTKEQYNQFSDLNKGNLQCWNSRLQEQNRPQLVHKEQFRDFQTFRAHYSELSCKLEVLVEDLPHWLWVAVFQITSGQHYQKGSESRMCFTLAVILHPCVWQVWLQALRIPWLQEMEAEELPEDLNSTR